MLTLFYLKWIGESPLWPMVFDGLIVILLFFARRPYMTFEKSGKNKWTIYKH